MRAKSQHKGNYFSIALSGFCNLFLPFQINFQNADWKCSYISIQVTAQCRNYDFHSSLVKFGEKILNTCSINSHFVIVYKSKWFFIKSRYHFYVKGLLFERSWFNRLSYNNHGIFTLNKELSVVLKPHPPALHLNILIDNSVMFVR